MMRCRHFMSALLLVCLALFSVSCVPSSAQGTGTDERQGYQYGLPLRTTASNDELLIEHTGYVVAFDTRHNIANYVAWTLTADRLAPVVSRKGTRFEQDPQLPTATAAAYYDYKDSGYDRGHLCPAADNTWRLQAMTDCFYMSNICPQIHALNDGVWNDLEMACRRWAQLGDTLHIVAGPLFNDVNKARKIGQSHRVPVPDRFYKVVLRCNGSKRMALAFVFTNDNKNVRVQNGIVSVNSVATLTGLTFFPDYTAADRKALFSSTSTDGWKFYWPK